MGRAKAAVIIAVLACPVIALSAPAHVAAATCGAQPSGPYPNDPDYAPAESAAGQAAGQTWDNEAWYLFDCIPQTANASSDPEGAAGMSVSALWNRAANPQRGRDDVTVAYMEGGVNWRIASSCELKDRSKLNTAELPYPEDAAGNAQGTYDLNGDGVVNVEDYRFDPRIAVAEQGMPRSPGAANQPFLHQVCASAGSANGAGYLPTNITPEDLIVTFGHCQIDPATHLIGASGCPQGGRFDNDGNGYPNDINGWNFNRDNNDPQTEQSVYAHFDGESGQLVGEGNNGFRNVGMCPLCRYIPIKAGDEAIDRPDRVAEAIVFAAHSGVDVMDVTDASLGLNQTVQDAIDYAWARGMVVVWASNDFESADHTDGMFYAHVWPGNSVTGDHSTRNGTTCPLPPTSTNQAYCAFVRSNTTFRSRSSLTSYGAHALFSVPNDDGSTSTGTPTNAGVAALVVSELKSAASRGQIGNLPLNADEVKQIVRASSSPISQPCPAAEPCFSGPAGASWNIQYGYGRPNLLAAAGLIDAGHIPPTASLTSPRWYQEFDPTSTAAVHVTADVAARRASNYTWRLQFGLGPEPLDTQWTTFASGGGSSPQAVSGDLDLSQIPASFWNTAYSIDPQTRLSIEQYDVSIRVQVLANGDPNAQSSLGEDRRAIHVDHDPSRLPGFPQYLNSSGDASPSMADIEGRGWLDTILPTSDGSVHAFRPDGSEAPGFPVHTNPAVGMDAGYAHNYLADPAWGGSVVPRPRDPVFSAAAVGDLSHTGALDIVAGTSSGYTYAWDGAGRLLPGFPVLNGTPGQFGLSVPPPDTPYSFEPENVTGASPVLAHLVPGSAELDIVQAAGDNHVYAWRPNGQPVPGWPVSVLLPAGTVPAGSQQTHDSKIVPTPAVIDINGDGIPDVVVGLDDTILGAGPAGAGVQAFLLAFDGRGTNAAGGGLLPGYPAKIQGLIQGYGVAQDFVTQGVESPAVYSDPVNGPQAVVNANLFLPFRVSLTNPSQQTPFAASTINPAPTQSSCPTPGTFPPTNPGECTLVQFTTSATLGKLNSASPVPQAFQMGSSAVDVFLGITQAPGFGVRVDNGLGGWDPTTGALLPAFKGNYVQGLGFFAAPAVADLDGDGIPDLIVPGDSGALTGFSGATGQPFAGFPKWTGGWTLFTPAVGDPAGNGHTVVAAVTREGYLFAWSTGGNACTGNSEAWHWHQDDWNDGRYGNDTRPPSAITDLTVSQQGANDVLSFTATGNDWRCGTAARYDLFTSSAPITQDNVGQATPISVAAVPGPAGTAQSITIDASANLGFLAIRAEDAAGNIGPIVLTGEPAAQLPEFPPGLLAILLLGGATGLRLMQKRYAPQRFRTRRRRKEVGQ